MLCAAHSIFGGFNRVANCLAARIGELIDLSATETAVLDSLEQRERHLRRGAVLVRENDRLSPKRWAPAPVYIVDDTPDVRPMVAMRSSSRRWGECHAFCDDRHRRIGQPAVPHGVIRLARVGIVSASRA